MIFHFLCPHQNFHLSIPGRTLRFRHLHDVLFFATQHLILSRCLSSCQLNAQTEQNSGEKSNPQRFHVSKFTKLQVIFHRTCQGLFRKFSGSTRNLALLKNLTGMYRGRAAQSNTILFCCKGSRGCQRDVQHRPSVI